VLTAKIHAPHDVGLLKDVAICDVLLEDLDTLSVIEALKRKKKKC
jgi:hypothetical protein